MHVRFAKLTAMLLLTLATLGSDCVNAQTRESPSDNAYELAVEFSRCAGLFAALGEFSTRFGKQEMADYYQGLHRGAVVASAMSASTAIEAGMAWELAENLSEPEVAYWKSIVLQDGITPKVEGQMQTCLDLNELQDALVEEARKQAYGFRD